VRWDEEQACFDSVAVELSLFYSDLSAYEGDSADDDEVDDADKRPVSKAYEQILQVIISMGLAATRNHGYILEIDQKIYMPY